FAPEALQALEDYSWPGNVRELLHSLERMVITQTGETVREFMLPEAVRDQGGASTLPLPSPTVASPVAPEHTTPQPTRSQSIFGATVLPLSELERMAIEHALRACQGSREDAARALGISPATIYRKLKHYGITKSRRGAGAGA
ncbi:MAG: helix-turn-helix domain-containing protein, partial [Planctomycetota bacterium]